MITVKCPNCKKEHKLLIESIIPDEQKMTITIKSESPFIDSEAIGKTIINTTKLLKAIAKDMGEKVTVFIGNIKIIECEVKIVFIIAKTKKGSK